MYIIYTVSPFEVAGSWPKELAGGPEALFNSGLLADNFSQGAIPLPNFSAPAIVWPEAAGP